MEDSGESYDLALMLVMPFFAFLVSEAAGLAGFLVLIIMAYLLSLYGKPNMDSGHATALQDALQSISSFSKTICYLLMGISLPLRLDDAPIPNV